MFTAPLNSYLAQALKNSPRAQELCANLAGRRLQIDIAGFPEPIWITASADSLRVAISKDAPADRAPADGAPADGAPADVTVRGSVVALLALAGNDAGDAIARGNIHLSGDEQLALQFQQLARLLRPNAEDMIGRLTGRIPAHLAARGLSATAAWGRSARDSMVRNAGDYLAHESRDLVPRAEAEGFLAGVEALRAQLNRAEARLAVVTAKLAPYASSPAKPSSTRPDKPPQGTV